MIDVLYDDDFCIIVNKPPNVLVHHSYYSRNIKDDSLLQLLRKQFVDENFYPVHRLDRKTSGLILLCKDKQYVSKFQELFNSKQIKKNYKALVRGFTDDNGIVNSPIKNNESGIYKDALTIYKTIKYYELDIPVIPYSTSRYSLIELEPKTGRTHQLRKHLNKIAHPIIGDHKYGNRHHNQMFKREFEIDNLFLQAYQLEFNHPILLQNINLSLSLPKFWKDTINSFNAKSSK